MSFDGHIVILSRKNDLVEKDGQIWVSYYSSHEGKAAIYLAKLTVQF